MAGEKFMQHDGSGGLSEIEAVQTGGTGKENKIPALDGTGRLDSTMMPSGIGADTVSVVTGENLAAGDLVNIYDNAGVATARKANATDGSKPCVGFVLAAVTSPAAAVVYLEGPITGLSGLTPGAKQFLSAATSGAITSTAPTGTGKVLQFIGRAVNATTVNFETDQPISLA